MAEKAPSEDSIAGGKKHGMRMRRGSDADKRYQSGARASEHDVKDHTVEIMDKLGGLTLSMGALPPSQTGRYLVGFITDESTAAGFALAGCLENGVAGINVAQPSKRDRKHTAVSSGGPQGNAVHVTAAVSSKEATGRRNFFIANRNTTQEELARAFRTLTRRNDIGVLAINGDMADKLQAEIKRHDAKAALPIIVPIPIDDDPYKCIEDSALTRPKMFGFINLNDPLQLFHQVELEYEHSLYHFHNDEKHGHAHHNHQGRHHD